MCFLPGVGLWWTVRAGLSAFLVFFFFLPLAMLLVVLATLLSLSVRDMLIEWLVLLEALLLWDDDELDLALPFDLAGDREQDCGDMYLVRDWPTTGFNNMLPLWQA